MDKFYFRMLHFLVMVFRFLFCLFFLGFFQLISFGEETVVSENSLGAFRHVGLINLPTAEFFRAGDVDYRGILGFHEGNRFTVALGIDYAATDQLRIGTLLLGTKNLISRVHFTFMELKDFYHLRLGAGFNSVLNSKDLTDWQNYRALNANNIAHYVVSSVDLGNTHLHLGISQPQTVINKGSGGDFLNFFDGLGHIVFGLDHESKDGSFILEYDGLDLNVGYRYRFDANTDTTLSYTNILQQQHPYDGLSDSLQTVNIEWTRRMNYFAGLREEIRKTQTSLREGQSSFDAMTKQYGELNTLFGKLEGDYSLLKSEFGTMQKFKDDLEELREQIVEETQSMRIENDAYRKSLKEDPSAFQDPSKRGVNNAVKTKFLLKELPGSKDSGSFRKPGKSVEIVDPSKPVPFQNFSNGK